MRICTVTMVVALSLLLGIAATAHGQSNDELLKEIRRLSDKVSSISASQDRLAHENRNLRRDNDELRANLSSGTEESSKLEVMLNSLARSSSIGEGTTIHSTANPITLSGAFRFRAGFTSNRDFGAVGNGAGGDQRDDTGTFIDARINVAWDFQLARNVKTHFEVISANLFDNFQADANTGGLDEVNLYQGWVLIDKLFGRDEIGTRFGRQEIVLGNELFFGNNSFYGGETHDATLLWWGQEEWSLTLVWVKFAINEGYNAIGHPYPTFQAGHGFDDDEAYIGYFTLKTIDNHVLDLYYAYLNANNDNGTTFGTLGNPIPDDTFAHIFGIRLAGNLAEVADGLDYNLEFAYETGDVESIAGLDVGGFIFEAEVGLTFNASNKFRVFGRFIFAEGADNGDTGFIPLYPDRHEQVDWDDHTSTRARWGLMDIIPLTNVVAGQIGFSFRPSENWILGMTFLGAWHDEDVLTTDGDMEDGIGWELDLFGDYRHSEDTTISFGVGVFLPNEGAPLEGVAVSAGNREDELAFLFYLQSLTTF